MDNNRNKIIRVSDLIGRHEEFLNSHSRYGDFRCYYKDHEHDDEEGDLVSIEDPSVFRLAEQFFSYNDLLDRLAEHSKKSYIHYWRRDSRTVDGAHMKTSRPIASSLKYYSVKFACIFGGQKFMSRGKGKRASISRRTNCPSHITVRANKCGQSLEVISVCNHHNHPVSRELYHRMPHDRRLPADTKEDVLDLLRLGFNQKRVRDYIEWETGKKLTNKDIHNLVAIDRRPKILLSEKRALYLEQVLADFEANKSIQKITKKRVKKEKHKSQVESANNGNCTDLCDDVAQFPDDISKEMVCIKNGDTFPVGHEIEISVEEGISYVPTINGNFLTYLSNRSQSPKNNDATLSVTTPECEQKLELLNETYNKTQDVPSSQSISSFSKIVNEPKMDATKISADDSSNSCVSHCSGNDVYLQSDLPNDVFIFEECDNEAGEMATLQLVNYDNEEIVEVPKHLVSDISRVERKESENDSEIHNNNTMNDQTQVTEELQYSNLHFDSVKPDVVDCEESTLVDQSERADDVVYFSDEEVVYEQENLNSTSMDSDHNELTCCETCGRLCSDMNDDIEKLRLERDDLLKETASLKRQKRTLLNEILCLKGANVRVDNGDCRTSLNDMKGDNVWIVIG